VGVGPTEDEGAAAADLPDALGDDPAHQAELADSVGLALLVVLDTLTPAERLAFVLHDLFAVSFDEIAPIVERTPTAARQLASRARRRVQNSPRAEGEADRSRQRAVVDAFLAASRGGDFEALLTVLDPDVVFRGDQSAVALGGPAELRGAQAVAKSFCGRADAAFPALLDGELGLIVAPKPERVLLVLRVTLGADGRIAGLDAVADRALLAAMDLVRLDG
jgi:RNA polymerase sigma-70 factor (ECF subfamily)